MTTEPKKVGRPAIGTPDDPLVTLTASVRQSDIDYLATIDRNLSKSIRQLIDQHRKDATHHG